MKKLILAFAAIILLTVGAFGQTDSSKFDFFAGYSYLHVGDAGDEANIPMGFELQGTGYFNKNFGITGDFSGHYKSIAGVDANIHNFLFGPTFRADLGRAKPFGHFLAGGERAGVGFAGGTASDTAFAYALGGGVDVAASSNISVRLVQVDWVRTNFVDDWQNHTRLSFGVVFKVGH
jgi:opacity protein-like surface antigen